MCPDWTARLIPGAEVGIGDTSVTFSQLWDWCSQAVMADTGMSLFA